MPVLRCYRRRGREHRGPPTPGLTHETATPNTRYSAVEGGWRALRIKRAVQGAIWERSLLVVHEHEHRVGLLLRLHLRLLTLRLRRRRRRRLGHRHLCLSLRLCLNPGYSCCCSLSHSAQRPWQRPAGRACGGVPACG